MAEPETANFILQESESEGTGSFALQSLSGWRSFADMFEVGSSTKFFYFIRHVDKHEMEVGVGYLTDNTTLIRDEVRDSTNSDNSPVDFTEGVKELTSMIPAGELNVLNIGISIFDDDSEIGSTQQIDAGTGLVAHSEAQTNQIRLNLASGVESTSGSVMMQDDGINFGQLATLDAGHRMGVTDQGNGRFTVSGIVDGIPHNVLSGVQTNQHHSPPTLSTIFGVLTDTTLKNSGDVLEFESEDVSNNLRINNISDAKTLLTIDEDSGEIFGDDANDTPSMLGRGTTVNQSQFEMQSGSQRQLHRLRLPSGTQMGIYSLGVSTDSGTNPANLTVDVVNETSGTVALSGNTNYQNGNPIAQVGQGQDEITIELQNQTGSTQKVSGFANFRIDEADPNTNSRTGQLLKKQFNVQQSNLQMSSGTELQFHRFQLPTGDISANVYAHGVSKKDGTTDPNLQIAVINETSGTVGYQDSSDYKDNNGEPNASVGQGGDEISIELQNNTGSAVEASGFVDLIVE